MKIFLLLITFLFQFHALAQGWVAHDGEKFTDHYASILHNKKFTYGDVIILGDKSFKYIDYLGEGNSTKVFKVESRGQEYALRIPLKAANFNDYILYPDFIDFYIDGQKKLREYGIPTVEIHDYKRETYALVSVEEYDFNGYEFFARKEHYPEKLIKEAKEKLLFFAREAAHFKDIGDFSPSQLVYSSKRRQWLILDMTDSHKFFSKVNDLTPFGIEFRVSLGDSYDERNQGRGQRYSNGSFFESVKRSITPWESDFLDELEQTIHLEREKILVREKSSRLALILALRDKSKSEIMYALNQMPERMSEKLLKDVRDLLYKDRKILKKLDIRVSELLPLRAKLANSPQDYKLFNKLLIELAFSSKDLVNILTIKRKFMTPEPLRYFFWQNLHRINNLEISESDVENLLESSYLSQEQRTIIKERARSSENLSCLTLLFRGFTK